MTSKWKRLLHCSAISLALGAILGIYLRGIFFEYNVVWTSTFIRNEETALTLIHIILYPGILFSNLLGLNLTGGLRIESLMSQSGAPAASWIHLYAITALVVIILPRFLFAMWVTKRIGKLRNDVKISSDAYFGDIVESQLKNLIKQEARISCVKFSEGVAEFVCLKLYDDKIVPELEAFRKNGGKIVDLKDRIGNVCATFESEMESYITQKGLVDFKQSLSSDIEHVLGGIQKDFTMDKSSGEKWADVSEAGSDSIVGKSVKPIGDSFINIIGATVTSSVGMVVATMSGGFGNTMGIAIIAELTALGGPVGFVIKGGRRD